MATDPKPAGHDGPRCGAAKKQGPGNCTQAAGWGTDHVGEGRCKLHGGCTPTVAKSAHLAIAERGARELFGRMAPDVVPVDNPLAAYAEFAGRVMAWMQHMDAMIGDLGNTSYEDARGEQHAHAVIELFERSMDRANTVLSSYARLNIDERLAKVTEGQAQAIGRAIDGIIAYYGGTDEQATQARQLAARHLRSVS